MVLASSEGHDRRNFVVVHEERLGFTTTIPGQTLEQLIRAYERNELPQRNRNQQ